MGISMRFTATEAGFKDGLGGASNAKSAEEYHYVLFGTQQDAQRPENSGAYFEYDDQSKGAVGSVEAVSIDARSVVFKLKSGKSIEVICGVGTEQWNEFQRGLRTVFPHQIVSAK